MKVQYRSRRREWTDDGITDTVVWWGSREEIEEQAGQLDIGSGVNGLPGTLDSYEIGQESPAIWTLTARSSVATDGDLIDKPKKAWGAKTCTLNGGMLSIPIENHKNYLAKWNHYLFAKAGENGEEPSVPDWWETATDTVMTAAMRRNYAWGSAYSDAPATEGETWTCIGEPSKPGVNSYDVGTYQITEVARFRSMEAAGKMIQNLLNTICMPAYTFGITGGDWKCDGASVSYNGKYWLATLTYTRSGDEGGWDDDLYAETKGAL